MLLRIVGGIFIFVTTFTAYVVGALSNVYFYQTTGQIAIQAAGGNVDKIMGVEPLDKKWEAFGWNVIIIDGHNFQEIFDALDKAKETKGKPTVIIAKTVKGKGVSFMENVCGFHGVAPTAEETERAIAELEKVSEI